MLAVDNNLCLKCIRDNLDFHLMYLNCSLKIKKEYKNLKELDNGIFMEMNKIKYVFSIRLLMKAINI